jgi:excisionase family DNA binding protein
MTTADHLKALAESLAGSDAPTVASLLGDLEHLKALVWEQLVRLGAARATAAAPDPLDDLRHLTPQHVAELLNLKPAYVHELCRTGRLPAIKHGKYWLIPQASLRERLAYSRRHIDAPPEQDLESLDPHVDSGPRALRRKTRPPLERKRRASPDELSPR